MCEIAIGLYVLQAAVVTLWCREHEHSWLLSIATAAPWPLWAVVRLAIGCRNKVGGGASK